MSDIFPRGALSDYISLPHSLSPCSYGEPTMIKICEETTKFVRTCEAIHAKLDTGGTLTPDDRDLIQLSGSELLSKLKPV